MGRRKSSFEFAFTDSALEDLRHLRKTDQTKVLDAIEQMFTAQPLTQSRNRKPLRANDLAMWEIRVGIHRVLYDVDEPQQQVMIEAIGWKEHNKLYIRGKEYQL